MYRLLVFSTAILVGCSSIPNLNFHSSGPQARVVERRDGQLLRYVSIHCRLYSDAFDVITYAALGDSERTQRRVSHAEIRPPPTQFCERLTQTPPEVGCTCEGEFCMTYEGEPVCKPDSWRWLAERDLWSREDLDEQLQTDNPKALQSFQLRWTTPNQLSLDGYVWQLRWVIHSGAEARECVALQPDPAQRTHYNTTPIALADLDRDGCIFDGRRLLIDSALKARMTRIGLRGRMYLAHPDCPLGYPADCAREDSFIFRTHVDRPAH